MKFRNSAALTVILVLFGPGAFAQLTGIAGHVIGADGTPVKNALIKFEGVDLPGISMRGQHMKLSTRSDKAGHYIYNGLPRGKWDVTLEVGGKGNKQIVKVPGVVYQSWHPVTRDDSGYNNHYNGHYAYSEFFEYLGDRRP